MPIRLAYLDTSAGDYPVRPDRVLSLPKEPVEEPALSLPKPVVSPSNHDERDK